MKEYVGKLRDWWAGRQRARLARQAEKRYAASRYAPSGYGPLAMLRGDTDAYPFRDDRDRDGTAVYVVFVRRAA